MITKVCFFWALDGAVVNIQIYSASKHLAFFFVTAASSYLYSVQQSFAKTCNSSAEECLSVASVIQADRMRGKQDRSTPLVKQR